LASDGAPANVPPGMPSISTDSRTESDFLTGTPTAATVEPMTWPARSRSTVHESGSCTELTVNVTRSAGVPCVPLTGFLGRTAAETEVTVATGLPAADPEPPDVDVGVVTCLVVVEVEADVALGLLLQPAHTTATHTAATGTAHARDTGRSYLSGDCEQRVHVALVRALTPAVSEPRATDPRRSTRPSATHVPEHP